MRVFVYLLALAGLSAPACAETPADLLAVYAQAAKPVNPVFVRFFAERGQKFFGQPHGREWSCSSCHTANPAAGEIPGEIAAMVQRLNSLLERVRSSLSGETAPGSGLGLSVVARIVQLHQAELVLSDGAEGRGLKVSVGFGPAEPG